MQEFSLLYPQGVEPDCKTLSDEAINDLSLELICDKLADDTFEHNIIKNIKEIPTLSNTEPIFLMISFTSPNSVNALKNSLNSLHFSKKWNALSKIQPLLRYGSWSTV